MSVAIAGLVLLAALLHASWNAILKGAEDRAWTLVIMQVTTLAASIALIPFLSAPSFGSWPWLVGGAVLHACYRAILIRALGQGDLGEIYPISRGASPPMVAAGAAVLTDDHLGRFAVIGILIVSAGILGIGWSGKRKLPAAALATALVTAAFTASYTIVDGIGARLSGNAVSFALWLFIVGGIATLTSTLANIRLSPRPRARVDVPMAIVCGLLQMFSYGAVIWACSLGPLGVVSALRETSVVFAVLIGYFFLGEKPRPQRFVFCVAIACGCACFAAQ